jgi:hypothetical protein
MPYLKGLSRAINFKNIKQNNKNKEASLSKKNDFSFEEGKAKI